MADIEEQINQWKKEIFSDGYPMSIGEVISMYIAGDLDVHPEFQRMYRWTSKQKSRFIESLLLSMPVPSFFVAQREDGVWDVVDGLQRLSTILSLVGELKDPDGSRHAPLTLESADYLSELDGLSWDGEKPFSEALKRTFKREKIDFKIIKKESDPDTKFELFQRLNTGGSALSDQELRNCLMIMLNKDFYAKFFELSEFRDFIECLPLTDKQTEEKYHMDLLSRFIVLQDVSWDDITEIGDVGDFITNKTREFIKKFEDGNINFEIYQDNFKNTFSLLDKILGEDSFRKYHSHDGRHKGPISLALFEAITLGIVSNIASYDQENATDMAVLKEKVLSFSSTPTFLQYSGSGVRAGLRLPKLTPFAREHFRK